MYIPDQNLATSKDGHRTKNFEKISLYVDF